MRGSAAKAVGQLGVGFVGAGAVVQAIHLPTLARMPELFSVRHIFDTDLELAAAVAEPWGARTSGTVEELLNDDEVDVVVVGSPPRFHAAQVVAAIRTGKKAVLCEKPLADGAPEARRVAEASLQARVPVIVGAMHTFDPAWLTARQNPEMQPGRVYAISSRIALPPNPGFEDAAAEIIRPARMGMGKGTDTVAEALRGAVLGLAIHDLPLIREFVGEWTNAEVVAARALRPSGYAIDVRVGDILVQLVGGMGAPGTPEWSLDVVGEDAHIRATFPPSYVHVGSAEVSAIGGGRTITVGPCAEDGYDAEWKQIHAAATDPSPHLANVASLVDDLDFALKIADGAVALLTGGKLA